MTIHKEGYSLLIKTILVLGLLNAALIFFLPNLNVVNIPVQIISGLLFLIVLQFFRNPVRTTIINPNHIIAPADGKVVVIEEVVETEYFKGPRRQVSIFMSPINVHVNRNPMSGIVKFFKYHPGLFLVAWHPKSSTENERTTTVVENENGVEVLFRQIAGALAKRIVWYIKENDKVVQGEDFGFIKFGSRVDIFLPLDAKILVNLGDRPVGGETVIAELV
jgi:phosphatidylserine decarboxylase